MWLSPCSQEKWKQAEMLLLTLACSPTPALRNENQDHKGRDRKLRTYMCCFCLVCLQSVPAHQRINWKANKQCFKFPYWMCLYNSGWFQTFWFLLRNIFPWFLKGVHLEDLKTVSCVLYSCKMFGAFLLSPFILFFSDPFFTSLKAEIPKGGCVTGLFESGTLICIGVKAVF